MARVAWLQSGDPGLDLRTFRACQVNPTNRLRSEEDKTIPRHARLLRMGGGWVGRKNGNRGKLRRGKRQRTGELCSILFVPLDPQSFWCAQTHQEWNTWISSTLCLQSPYLILRQAGKLTRLLLRSKRGTTPLSVLNCNFRCPMTFYGSLTCSTPVKILKDERGWDMLKLESLMSTDLSQDSGL
jgi:hypothetical protein